jgi:hypothetical protein
MLAPIILFVYKRLWHTQQTVESLKKNTFANESNLFVFSDGPKNMEEKSQVDNVREYVKTIQGFKNLIIKENENNLGLANSVIRGVSEVIEKYKKAIVVEDDLISSPDFLRFINAALNFYKDNLKVFSISGYGFQIKIPGNYNQDVYIYQRSSSWGWGTWLDRWQKADWDVKDFDNFLADKVSQKLFNEGGEDLTPMFKAQMFKYIDSWGIRWAYTHFKNHAYCLYPAKSKIKNIGTDKSGTHFKGSTDKYDVQIPSDSLNENLTKNLAVDKYIKSQINNIFRLSLIRKIINIFKLNPAIASLRIKFLHKH